MVINQGLIFRGKEDDAMLFKVERLRQTVWRSLVNERAVKKRFALDKFDQIASHIAIVVDNEVVGSGRVIPVRSVADVPDQCSFGDFVGQMNFPIAVMNRLVVHSDYQRMGLSHQINQDRIDLARQFGVLEIWVEVAEERVSSMLKIGFQDMGSSFDKSIPGNWRILRKEI